jgi:hypothetical protein
LQTFQQASEEALGGFGIAAYLKRGCRARRHPGPRHATDNAARPGSG